MAAIFIDGFDKYGPASSNASAVLAALEQGEWTSGSTYGTSPSLVAGLSSTGQALGLAFSGAIGASLNKTLPGNYATIIGGFRFQSDLSEVAGLIFLNGGAGQFSICVNAQGKIELRNGAVSTYPNTNVVATSSASITAGVTHYIEWNITPGGAYAIYLDSVEVISGTGGTGGSAINAIGFNGRGGGGGVNWIIDDFYLFDTSGATNNAPLLTNPIILTSFPTADAQRQFLYGAGSSSTSNWPDVSVQPTEGDSSFVYSNTVGDEDLYQAGTIGSTAVGLKIYTAAVKVNARLSDTGVRTMTIQCKSGATDSASASQVPSSSAYAWFDSFFDTDPATGVAWTKDGRNAATFGVKVAT